MDNVIVFIIQVNNSGDVEEYMDSQLNEKRGASFLPIKITFIPIGTYYRPSPVRFEQLDKRRLSSFFYCAYGFTMKQESLVICLYLVSRTIITNILIPVFIQDWYTFLAILNASFLIWYSWKSSEKTLNNFHKLSKNTQK